MKLKNNKKFILASMRTALTLGKQIKAVGSCQRDQPGELACLAPNSRVLLSSAPQAAHSQVS